MTDVAQGPWARAKHLGGKPAPTGHPVTFSGRRGELFVRLLRGYLLMVPTLGLYRFWLTTTKRRFYWQNTLIGGERLEYTGSALQLLIGFMFAVGVFLPIYLGFFYLSFQSSTIAMIGYGTAALLLWFLAGYAIYRGRDFRLSRTLWRGIRFDQRGSAFRYALRRFLWSFVVLFTAGLAYPFMAANLWRYRYTHTWFGDRQFSFSGSWRTIAGPFYWAWGAFAVSVAVIVAALIGREPTTIVWSTILSAAVGAACFFYYRSRETSRMFSAVRLGDASLSVRVKARSLFGQFFLYGLSLMGALIVLGVIGFGIATAFNTGFRPTEFSAASIARAGWTGVALGVGGYLATVSAFTLLGEVFIDCGFWMLVSRGATITNIASLDSVGATAEDASLVGEGLADALNVGSF
jgi:uncharacterized membrane protein YjgN (DUF898 family)